jgi:hypothetical protein
MAQRQNVGLGVRDGSSDAEQVIDSIPEDQRGGKSYEPLLGRLVQYLRSGMELEDATAWLRESQMPDGGRGRESGEAGGAGEGRTDLDATTLIYSRRTVCDA